MQSKVHFDKSMGLAYQVFAKDWDFDEYLHWVNQPKHIDDVNEGILMFDTPILESLSKQPWQQVIFFWALILG